MPERPVPDEGAVGELETRIEAVIAEARQAGLDDHTISVALAEASRKLAIPTSGGEGAALLDPLPR